MNDVQSQKNSENSYFGDEEENMELDQNKNPIDPQYIMDTVNKEIKYVVENSKDLSYSNSNSKISDQFQNKEQLLYSRYWCVKKKNNSDYTDSSSAIMDNKKINLKENTKNNEKKEEEKILYYNSDEENSNKFNDDFDEEDMEEKTIEKNENDINEINSIKVNNNNLNKKDSIINISNTLSPDINIKPKINNNNNTIINEKINLSNTPNKLNQSSFIPYIYNTNSVQSFISSYNNYPSNLSKGSFISTNNSSNQKYIKNDEIYSSELEEDEIKPNNVNNIYTHGNKFGPHLMDYNHIQNNSMNIEQSNLTNINNINNFNLTNNYMFNGMSKMNLNMIYYFPMQQQTIPTNNNYMTNGKIIPNINKIITPNENNNINTNLKSAKKEKEINNEANNNINTKKVNNNNNGNKVKEKEKSNSKEKKNKNNKNDNNSNSNNYRNNNGNNNYKNNDTHNYQNKNNNSNNNNNNPGGKGEKNLLNLDDIISGKDTRTTVMIRNIPIKYTDNILVNALEEFKGKYDCLYMPYDYEKNGNKGYAFINFVNPLHILLFYEKFNGKKWMHFESNKICELNMAHFQGVNEIQKHAKNFKGLKKNCISNTNENIVIPSKYLSKIKNRFPKMKYENKNKKEFVVKSFE